MTTFFKKHTASLTAYVSIVFSMAVGFVLLFCMTRYAGVEVYGQYVIVKSTAGIITGLLAFRSGEAVTRFCKEGLVENDRGMVKSSLFIGLGFDLIVSALMLVLLGVLSSFAADRLLKNSDLQSVFFIYSFVTILTYLRNVPIGYFLAVNSIVIVNCLRILESLLVIAGVIYISVCQVFTLKSFVIWNVAVVAFVSLIFFVVFAVEYRRVCSDVCSIASGGFMKRYIVFSAKTFFSGTLKSSNQNIDNVILAYFLMPQEVGVYQAIKKLFSLIEVISQPWKMIAYAPMVGMYVKGKLQSIIKYICRKTVQITCFSLGSAVVLFFSSDVIFQVMGLNYNESYDRYALIIAASFVVASTFWWGRTVSNVVDPNLSLVINVGVLIYHVTVGVFLIDAYGLFGAVGAFLMLNIVLAGVWFFSLWFSVGSNRVRH